MKRSFSSSLEKDILDPSPLDDWPASAAEVATYPMQLATSPLSICRWNIFSSTVPVDTSR